MELELNLRLLENKCFGHFSVKMFPDKRKLGTTPCPKVQSMSRHSRPKHLRSDEKNSKPIKKERKEKVNYQYFVCIFLLSNFHLGPERAKKDSKNS